MRAVQGQVELREALGNERESCRRAGAAAASAAHDRRLLTEAVQLQKETQDVVKVSSESIQEDCDVLHWHCCEDGQVQERLLV